MRLGVAVLVGVIATASSVRAHLRALAFDDLDDRQTATMTLERM